MCEIQRMQFKLHIRDRRMAAEEVHKSVGWALSRNQRTGAVV